MKKNKEHKKGESTIGKIIYGFLLFMPLLAIGVTCLVTTFNKNVNSFTNDNETEYTQITTTDTFTEGDIYNFSTRNVNLETTSSQLTLDLYFDVEKINYTSENWFSLQIKKITLYRVISNPSTYITIYGYDNNNTVIGASTFLPNTTFLDFDFKYRDIGNPQNFSVFSTAFYSFVTRNTSDNIANVFYYSVNKVTESPLFSWATNSVIYTTMNATCTQLSITTPFIPLILSYWLIISIIYFLYDIALMLIWLLHDKIHEMRDSLA